jgi:hypothetical protein
MACENCLNTGKVRTLGITSMVAIIMGVPLLLAQPVLALPGLGACEMAGTPLV